MNTVRKMILEVWRGKEAHQRNTEHITKQRERLIQRLKTEGFYERRDIPAYVDFIKTSLDSIQNFQLTIYSHQHS